MLAEQMVRTGSKLVADYPPNGKDYWSARFWDREKAERNSVIGGHYRAQRVAIADLIEQYGATADHALEFACGTGEFTKVIAERTNVSRITALDISVQGLAQTRRRVDHPGLELIHGDFWDDHHLAPAPLVVCIDAIHHLGDVRAVLRRLRSYVSPGGVLIGSLWTADNFHEFQRERYGNLQHTARSALFLASAIIIRVSNGSLRTASYRTQLRDSSEISNILESAGGQILDIVPGRFFVSFACRA
jgi:SAM-dependent methyltransferase